MRAIIVGSEPDLAGSLTRALNLVGIPIGSTQRAYSLEEVEGQLVSDVSAVVIFWMVSDQDESHAAFKKLTTNPHALVVAVGCSDDSREILGYLRSGANEYLDSRADLVGELTDLLQRLATTRIDVPQRGRMITVTSCGGGSGSTTIAANISAVLAGKHKGCALIDLHPYGGDLPAVLQLLPDFTLRELAQKGDSLDAALLHKSLVKHKSGVCVLASPTPFVNREPVCPQTIKSICSIALREFPFVVVDGEDLFHPEQRTALENSDEVVLVLRLDFASLVRAQQGIRHLIDELDISPNAIHLIASRCGQPRELSVANAEGVLGRRLTAQIPNDPARALAAINIGVPVVSEFPQSELARSLTRLAGLLAGENTDSPVVTPNFLRGLVGNVVNSFSMIPFLA